MKNSIYATAALVAVAAADSVGSAIVVNKCSYDVTLANVPAADGGYSEVDKILSPEGTYTQTWTSLTNGNGWSIKLSNSSSLSNILQYEYTYQNDGTIWYDLSEVNGNPWDGNWEITSGGSCSPKQQAYRYATDDAYGMQSCPADSTITVTLCSGDESNDSAASSASSSAAAETTAAVVTSTLAPAATSSAESKLSAQSVAAESTSSVAAQSSASTHEVFWATASAATSTKAAATTQAPTTTFLTSVITSASSSDNAEVIVTVTEVATATATQWGHHWGGIGKRERHQHRRHPHGN